AAVNSSDAFFFRPKPVDFDELLVLVKKAIERRRQSQIIEELRNQLLDRKPPYFDIIGHSRAMQNLFDIIESVAESDANVLIIGESGTGKELVASAIHHRSHRAKFPFMQVN